MTYVVPCESPDRDPNDWFIEPNGLQYSDEPLLSAEDREQIEREHYPDADATEAALAHEEEAARKHALRRRRHAKDACHVECYFRLQCLELALDGPSAPEMHGTWGGYYAEELREIRRVREAR